MKVTAIRQQQKDKNRYAIFIDGKYNFSLSADSLLASRINTNQELSQEVIGGLKKQAQTDSIYSKVLNYIAVRPRSEWEVRTYLNRKACPPPLAAKTLNKLSKNGLINDRAFAKSWIENRRLLKPVSRRRLSAELFAKHVPKEVIEELLDADVTDEQMVLRDLVNQKRRISRYQDNLVLMQYLARQGFNYADIKAVINDKI